jgi:hypothetical protein
LYVKGYNFAVRPDDPGKRHTEITQSTANIYRCLTGFDEIPKNLHGVVKNLPERVIETIAKPPGTGMRAQQQESPKEIYPFGLHFPNYPEQLPANSDGQGVDPAACSASSVTREAIASKSACFTAAAQSAMTF